MTSDKILQIISGRDALRLSGAQEVLGQNSKYFIHKTSVKNYLSHPVSMVAEANFNRSCVKG